MRKASALLALASVICTATQILAVPVLSSMTTWGNGDGWRAPNEIVTGDAAGTATGSNYNFLGTGSLERGIAFNPLTGHVLVASRSAAGQSIRILHGATGADLGAVANSGTGTVTGGTLSMVKVGVDADGAVYTNNLTTNVGTTAMKVYKWSSEAAAAPTTFFNGTITGFSGTPRLGDIMDVTGSGTGVRMAFGVSGGPGYAIIDNAAVGTAINTITPNLTPTGPGTSAFTRGITFTNSNTSVWGKGTDSTVRLWQTTYTTSPAAGTRTGAPSFGASQAPLDYIEIQGIPYLATVDLGATAGAATATNRALVTVFKMSDPANPVQVAQFSTVTIGSTNVAAGGIGELHWGATTYVNDQPVTALYAMATNQGIQALNFQVDSVPEVSSFLAVGLVGLVLGGAKWLRRKSAA